MGHVIMFIKRQDFAIGESQLIFNSSLMRKEEDPCKVGRGGCVSGVRCCSWCRLKVNPS
jgi:hypothetical protein